MDHAAVTGFDLEIRMVERMLRPVLLCRDIGEETRSRCGDQGWRGCAGHEIPTGFPRTDR